MTDHKTKAQAFIDAVAQVKNVSDSAALAGYAVAQVHATLALVEQQRIGNLIAYAQMKWVGDNNHTIFTGPEMVIQIRNEVGEALGL